MTDPNRDLRFTKPLRSATKAGRMTEWLERVEAWHDFYVIMGSAAAGLTGLMFVVITLSPHTTLPRTHAGVRGFVTPTVVFFATVLLISAVMTVPALSAHMLGGFLGLGGLGGVVYLIVTGGHKTWRESELDRLDWFWYVGLPLANYLLISGAAVGIWGGSKLGLEILGGAVILLLVDGIRNAWDLVIWRAQQAKD
jgi:hypothetical protein